MTERASAIIAGRDDLLDALKGVPLGWEVSNGRDCWKKQGAETWESEMFGHQSRDWDLALCLHLDGLSSQEIRMGNFIKPALRQQVENMILAGEPLMEVVRATGAAKNTVKSAADRLGVGFSRSSSMYLRHAKAKGMDSQVDCPYEDTTAHCRTCGKPFRWSRFSQLAFYRTHAEGEQPACSTHCAVKTLPKMLSAPKPDAKPEIQLADEAKAIVPAGKKCNKCGGTEPETYFYPSQKSLCKECQTRQARLSDRAKSEKYVAPDKRRPRYEIDEEGRKLDEKPPMLAEYDHPAEPEPIASAIIPEMGKIEPAPIIRDLRTTEPASITPMAEAEIPTERLTVYESCLKIFAEMALPAGIDDALDAIMDMQRREWDQRPPVPTLKAPLQLLDEAPVGWNKAEFARAGFAYLHERLTRTPCCEGDFGFGFLHGVAQVELEYDPDGWFYCSIGVRQGKTELTPGFMGELTRDMAELFPVYVWCEQIGEICNTLSDP